MFNQQEYINNYIKEKYKTFKIRIKQSDKMLLNKISSEDNINKYILDLIRKDIMNNRKFNYINNDIIINFELSKKLQYLVDEIEEADILGDYGLYMNLAYAIDAQAKKEVSNHIITESNWNNITRRYCL